MAWPLEVEVELAGNDDFVAFFDTGIGCVVDNEFDGRELCGEFFPDKGHDGVDVSGIVVRESNADRFVCTDAFDHSKKMIEKVEDGELFADFCFFGAGNRCVFDVCNEVG